MTAHFKEAGAIDVMISSAMAAPITTRPAVPGLIRME